MPNTSPNTKDNSFRAARIAMLRTLIDKVLAERATCRLIDIGGTYNFWHVWRDEIDWRRTEVVCVNLDTEWAAEGKDETRVRMLQGTACDLAGHGDGAYDIAFSNSVLQSVGLWRDMVAMSNEVRRVAPRYFVQAPAYWFPIEPSARVPFIHWIPEPIGYRILMARQCGFYPKARTVSEAVGNLQSSRLLDHRQMQALFHDGRVVRERFYGFTKSYIAIKD